MVGHTPAPWGVSEDGCWIQPNSGSSPMVEGRYLSICVSATSEEDKNLIIAAPELLEALKMARESFIVAGSMPLSDADTLEMIDSAIAKAEGK